MDFQTGRTNSLVSNITSYTASKNEFSEFLTIQEPITFISQPSQLIVPNHTPSDTLLSLTQSAPVHTIPDVETTPIVKVKKPRKKKTVAIQEPSASSEPDPKPRKCRGKDLHVQSKEMILNVYNYFRQEAIFYIERPLVFRERVEFKRYLKRTAQATGKSPATVMRVMKEYERTGHFSSPKKRVTKKRVTVLNNDDKDVIKRLVGSVYSTNDTGNKPSCRDLLKFVKTQMNFQGSLSSFRRVLKDLGFKNKDGVMVCEKK